MGTELAEVNTLQSDLRILTAQLTSLPTSAHQMGQFDHVLFTMSALHDGALIPQAVYLAKQCSAMTDHLTAMGKAVPDDFWFVHARLGQALEISRFSGATGSGLWEQSLCTDSPRPATE